MGRSGISLGSLLTVPELLLDRDQPAIEIPGGLAMLAGCPILLAIPSRDGLVGGETALASFSLAGAVRFYGEGKVSRKGGIPAQLAYKKRDMYPIQSATTAVTVRISGQWRRRWSKNFRFIVIPAYTMPLSCCAAKT